MIRSARLVFVAALLWLSESLAQEDCEKVLHRKVTKVPILEVRIEFVCILH